MTTAWRQTVEVKARVVSAALLAGVRFALAERGIELATEQQGYGKALGLEWEESQGGRFTEFTIRVQIPWDLLLEAKEPLKS